MFLTLFLETVNEDLIFGGTDFDALQLTEKIIKKASTVKRKAPPPIKQLTNIKLYCKKNKKTTLFLKNSCSINDGYFYK